MAVSIYFKFKLLVILSGVYFVRFLRDSCIKKNLTNDLLRVHIYLTREDTNEGLNKNIRRVVRILSTYE